jgi:SAM-dependent methyltransferase
VLLADAAHVPLRDRCADLVVACMVLLDVDDLDAAIGEAHRVLSDWGVLCVAIVHPFASAQDPAGIDNNDPRFPDAYLTERRTEVRVERDGVGMTFVSAHRPLSRYADSLAAAGFAITALREFGDKVIPWLLVIRAERLPARHGPEGLVGRGLFIGVAPGGTSATSASV